MNAPSYRRLAESVAARIRAGQLPPGTRLPTHRAFARRHGVALATATRVYAELASLGLVVGEPGRGTFVRDLPVPSGAGVARIPRSVLAADLSFNQPLASEQVDLLRRSLRDLSTSGNLESLLYQQPPGGRRHERAVVADHLARRGIVAEPERVVLVGGAQQGLDVVFGAVTAPGDVVAADALTYPGLRMLAREHSLELAPIPADGAGPDLAAFERLCRTRTVRAIYTIPTMHNPLGWVLDAADRERLASIARAHDCAIVEDGTYAFLAADAPPPITSLAPERSYYVSGLSKSVATGLRFGYVVTPPDGTDRVVECLRASSWGMPGIMTTLATEWIRDGVVDRLETERRVDAVARQAIARASFADLDMLAHPSSYFVWIRLDPELRMGRVANTLAENGILVSTADAFATTRYVPHAIRVALGTPDIGALGAVLDSVADTIVTLPT
ncbi:PLP-dependent aminotransferase family protein [Rhodococcus sp. ACT016]|uniref:aminotransferase-like domain-containing protein n=1 Tax=Rhodococcus sp. ACT016 TaxID=3134808 RepID=UPI003D288BB0